MKKIGEGIQYNVYDIGNDRVLKIETSFLQKIFRFHKIAPKYSIFLHLVHNIKTTIGAGKMTSNSIKYLSKNSFSIDLALVGNPVIKDGNNYEQDFVLPLGKELQSTVFSKQKELINQYIDNILSGWDYGFSDTVFNFMINAGVTTEGKVILTDLGELCWDKEEVKRLIESKHWEKRSSFNKLENIELKDYIREQFNNNITILNLDKRWGSKINNPSSNIIH